MLEMVDGEWLRISVDELGQITSAMSEDGETPCMVNLVGNINKYNNSVAELYNKNPFITSTTKDVTVAAKGGGPVHKVVLDSENLNNFVSAMQNSSLAQDLSSCMNEINDLTSEVSNLPEIYVEVDKDYNFTRLYFTSEPEDADMTLTTDLGFSYPENINIAEPTEYKDFSSVVQEIFMSMYDLSGETVVNQ